ncbi:DEAD-box ATP-dependent RNA helicase 50 [Neltuma alba]|uniref:DEAD-box ATP-dependent RNA helicase 50 n=1 Tax=Neltuma alba TaxID=207710 RepID=UPI0010A55C9E|nr:DEAD-box ATP-dependent RNA helicase 50 [Prosopis alba]
MLLGQAPPVSFRTKPNCLELQIQSHVRLLSFAQICFCDTPCTKMLRSTVGNAFLVRAGHSPTPKDVLSWNPNTANDGLSSNVENSPDISIVTEGFERDSVITNSDSMIKSRGRLSGSFDKLNAQKVKGLIHRTIHKKQERSINDDNLVVEHPELGIEDDWEQSEESNSHVGYQNTPNKSQNNDNRTESSGILVERHSASRLKGWGGGGSSRTFKTESKKLLKEQRKRLSDSDFFSRKSFKDLGCSEYMIESLAKQFYLRPSHIQAMAFEPVYTGKSCMIADQSGSGKTVAYLAPIIQKLRQEELEGLSNCSSQAPRVVILAPTAELASQVLANCRSMSKSGVPFKSMVVTGGFRQRTQLENLEQGVDVLIATPGRFMFLIKEGFLQLTNLRCAVLDEVDILFGDEDFEVSLQCLINSSPVATQYLFVTATLPKDIYNKLVEVFPDCEVIMGPSMHRISSRLEEVLVDCSGADGEEKSPDTAFLNKKTALLQIAEGSPVPKTIVFCNKIETCRKVENALKRFDRKEARVQVLPFHAAMTQELRLANMEKFTHSQSKEVSQFLVCTDRASRGIDFTGVDHVILFDFPRDPSEYVRRVGRTARGAAGKGKAYIFVVGKQVSLARKIMDRNRKGHPLHHVPSAYELMK